MFNWRSAAAPQTAAAGVVEFSDEKRITDRALCYGITSALLAGGTALALVTQSPVGAQVAQNESSEIAKVVPRSGRPKASPIWLNNCSPRWSISRPGRRSRSAPASIPLPGRASRSRRSTGRRLGLPDLGRRLYRHQQPCDFGRPARRGGQSGHRDADQPEGISRDDRGPRRDVRSGAAQDRCDRFAVREIRRGRARRASAIGSSRSATRSASARR